MTRDEIGAIVAEVSKWPNFKEIENQIVSYLQEHCHSEISLENIKEAYNYILGDVSDDDGSYENMVYE